MQQNRLPCLEEQDRICETKLEASQTAHEKERRINQQTMAMFCPNVPANLQLRYQTHTRTEHEITWRRRGLVVSAGTGVVEKVTYQREHIVQVFVYNTLEPAGVQVFVYNFHKKPRASDHVLL